MVLHGQQIARYSWISSWTVHGMTKRSVDVRSRSISNVAATSTVCEDLEPIAFCGSIVTKFERWSLVCLPRKNPRWSARRRWQPSDITWPCSDDATLSPASRDEIMRLKTLSHVERKMRRRQKRPPIRSNVPGCATSAAQKEQTHGKFL